MFSRKYWLLILTGTGIMLAPVLVGAAAPSGEEDGKEKTVEAKPLIIYESPLVEPSTARQKFVEMDLLRWPVDGFYGAFNKLMNDLITAHGVEKPAVMLDFAELYLSQMLLSEAGSILDSIVPETKAQGRRHMALSQALSLLRGNPIKSLEQSPLIGTDRPDHAFWMTLEAIAKSDADGLTASIPAGFAAMVHQPRPVLRATLPVFLEAAIAVGQTDLAQVAVQLLDELPELSDAPVGLFLRGRVAELVGNEKTALDYYFEAASGWDRYAARGRLALADMALGNDSEGALLAARDVLVAGADSWRGDNYELSVLMRLAKVSGKLGDIERELITYGQVVMRFPLTPQATGAREKIESLLDQLYDKGVDGSLPLANWMNVHLRLMPIFKEYPGFPDQVERLADKAFDLGGYSLAITEYTRAIMLRSEIAHLFGATPEQKPLDRLAYKLGHAQFKSGDPEQARATLEQIDTTGNPTLQERVSALLILVLDSLGDGDGVLQTQLENPNAHHLRSTARAMIDRQMWPEAIGTLLKLWEDFPSLFNSDDAAYLLIAAYHNADIATAERVVAAFPTLTKTDGLPDLAADMLVDPAPILPLNKEGADARLGSLDKTLDNIEASGL